MASSKSIDIICVVVLVLSLLLTVLFMNGEAIGIEKVVDADAEQNSGTAYFTANDLNVDWDTSSATVITLNGGSAEVSGGGAYAYDGGVVISNAGWYVISGTLTDGNVTVDAYDSSKVWILLSGVDITCSDDACLRVDQADKVFLTLSEGSENSFTSGAEYSEDALSDGTGGTIFAHDDLTINGSGTLTITAQYKHGIDANDSLVITGGTINITCPQDGLHVNDECNICGASLTVSAGDDGIHSDTSVYIESGMVQINECNEGIEAPHIEISGGDVTIYPTDDGLNANGASSLGFGMMGGMGGFSEMQQTETAVASDTADSAEEDEEESYIRISGGTLTIINGNARDADGIDSNGSIYITGGTIRVSMANNGGYALDCGSESGGVMEISGGTLVGCGSYAMAESFDSSSTQPSILYTYSAGAEAGTTVALEDTDGNVILEYTAPCAFSCVNLSCPELTLDETYHMVIGDNVEEITITEVSASYGDALSGGFGGTMNFGGMRSRSDFSSDGEGDGTGGHGRWQASSDDTSEDGAEHPAPSDFSGEMPEFNGEMPERPAFSDGEMPDFSQFEGEQPDFSGGDSESGGFRGGGMREFGGQGVAAAEDTVEETDTGFVPDAQTWLLLCACLLVLLLGLVIGKIFKRY